MNTVLRRLSPSATDMIRADHSRVLASFHRYALDARPRTKQALAGMICTALEIHAEIEERIFYPAMRDAGSAVVGDLEPEHAEMKRLIATVRTLDAADPQFDLAFMELMRCVIHHVADEETTLLPNAEAVLGSRLGDLGAKMAALRTRLTARRVGMIAADTARANPASLLVAAGVLVTGAFLLARRRKPLAHRFGP